MMDLRKLFTAVVLGVVASAYADDSTLTPPLVTARALGLGNNLVPLVDDASATVWNPARLVRDTKWSILADWSRFEFDTHSQFYAVGYSDGLNGFGISYRAVDLDGLVGFNFDERITTLAYGRRFGALRLGVAYNFVDIQTDFANADGGFWTFGADYQVEPGWTASLRAYEVGYRLTYDGAPRENARSTWDFGVAKRFVTAETPITAAVTFADFGDADFEDMVRLAVEAELSSVFRLRLGMQRGRFTGGLGLVNERGFSLEFGLSEQSSLGRVIAVTGGVRF